MNENKNMKTKLKSKYIIQRKYRKCFKNTIEANIKYIYDSFDNENKIKEKQNIYIYNYT